MNALGKLLKDNPFKNAVDFIIDDCKWVEKNYKHPEDPTFEMLDKCLRFLTLFKGMGTGNHKGGETRVRERTARIFMWHSKRQTHFFF